MEIQIKPLINPIYQLNLQLTESEAQAFMCVVGSITGLPKGPRGMFDNIFAALEAQGIEQSIVSRGAIHCVDEWPA